MKFPRKQRGAHGQVETTGADGGDQGSWYSWPGSGCGPEGSLLASKVMMPEKDKDGWVESILSPCPWPPSALGKMADVSLLLSKFTSSREVCGPWAENRPQAGKLEG